jgi:hypothetical protein
MVDKTSDQRKGLVSQAGRNGTESLACLVVDNNPNPHLDICLIQVAHCLVSFCIGLCQPEGNEESRGRQTGSSAPGWIGLVSQGQTDVKKPRVLRSHLAGQRRRILLILLYIPHRNQHHNTTTQHFASHLASSPSLSAPPT